MKEVKNLMRIWANTKSAFTRIERYVDNYAVEPKPEQLDVRPKLMKTRKNYLRRISS